MSDDRRKFNKHSTGTVPKVKYTVKCRNNNNNTGGVGQSQYYSDRDNLRNLPNNLSSEWPPRRSESNFHRNSQTNFEILDIMEETHQNGIFSNGTTTSSRTSSSNSRRNSSGTVPKCDNVTKYPNKKQIEDKLNQIREYLHITTSLMSSMKNPSEDQICDENEKDNLCTMIDDLKDSEAKLNLLINGIDDDDDDENLECINDDQMEDQTNRETLNLSLSLKQKGDSRLRDARQVQERLSQGNNRMENNLQEYDLAISELEETTKILNGETKGDVNNFQHQEEERFINDEIEELQNQIQVMHSANEDRNKLIHLLDKRDAELRSQHMELQSKLSELQTKKSQVDHLVAALQNRPRQEEEMGSHVRKIVLMKEQLAKLKDMLELVENTEVIMENGTQEEQAIACDIYNKAESFIKGNVENQVTQVPSINLDNRSKQVNKNTRETRTDSKISEKLALQAELKAKKRELEEIMGKHKASTSNLNHDVGTSDNKSDFSCSNSIFDNVSGVWAPLNQNDSERYSSDEGTEDANEYSEIPTNQANLIPQYEPFETSTTTNDANTSFSRGSSVSNLGQVEKQNVQKQLELIRSVCDSMLPQINNQQNVHLRNNLTPSPIYSDLRQFSPHPTNALVNQETWLSSNQQNVPYTDVNNYQNWLTTNTLQTQAFMLNSLNQCCQMLWLQQRELTNLRGIVTNLQQDRLPSPHHHVDTSAINHKVNQLPNIQPNDPIFSNNLRLIDSTGNNMNVTNIQGGNNENVNHLWNGQALNNQVPPGNRANNYWDNFRSYSRQNLFSTKSNDGIQNLPSIDRTNLSTSSRFETHSTPKSNSQVTTQENTPQRSCVKPSRRYTNTNIAVVPPDVLNINQNIKNEGLPLPQIQNETRTNDAANIRTPNRRSSNNISPENLQNSRSRNIPNEINEGNSKSKLFEELRENVYKEVASLISANEARPHFLIQLFRDLQLISSDPLRLKTLQSIQVLISQSLRNQNLQDLPNQEMPSSSVDFSMQSTVWSPIPPNSVPRNATILEGLISKKDSATTTQATFHEIIPFLNDNEHLTLNQQLSIILKQKFLECKSFKKIVRDTIFQKHFSNVLDDVFNLYSDKPLCTVKIPLLQSARDLLDRELSFMNLIQNSGDIDLRCQIPLEQQGTVQIQNEDLAEADQSHLEDEDVEEEGAVGFLEPIETNGIKEEIDSNSIEVFPTEAESQYQLGLDQVPTRLPTKSKSRSNTPIKGDRSKHEDKDHLN